jgi:hypothetical protein
MCSASAHCLALHHILLVSKEAGFGGVSAFSESQTDPLHRDLPLDEAPQC